MAEPILRFTRDDGGSYPAWEEKPLGTLVSDNMEPVPTPKEGYRRVGIYCHAKGTFQEDVPAENVLDVDTMYRIHRDNLIVNITFAWEHAVAIVKPEDEGLLVSHRFPEYSFNDGQVPSFYKYLVLRPYFRNQLSLASPGGAGRNRVLNKAQFKKIPVTVPCEEEQQKIADFLSSVDEVITASEEEVANLETQKKAVMKKIFSQEVRFKREDGSGFPEWEEKALGSFSKRVTRKNKDNSCKLPLTISAEYGLIDQSEFFNKTVASKDMSTYYLLQNGEFAFNKSTSKDYPVGAIKRLDRYDVGAVSPLYICFELYGDTVLSDFAVQYFETDCWHQGVLDIAQEGARTHGLLNISVAGFFEIVHEIPSDIEEQRLIADFLSDFDEAIAAAKKELELWKELKKGLLQQMFV